MSVKSNNLWYVVVLDVACLLSLYLIHNYSWRMSWQGIRGGFGGWSLILLSFCFGSKKLSAAYLIPQGEGGERTQRLIGWRRETRTVNLCTCGRVHKRSRIQLHTRTRTHTQTIAHWHTYNLLLSHSSCLVCSLLACLLHKQMMNVAVC